MLKVGRYTASLLLIAVGVLLLLDQLNGTNLLHYVLEWWPLLLITLGLEYLMFHFVTQKGDKQVRFDFGGLLLSLLISAVVVGSSQSTHLPESWKDFKINIDTLQLSFSSEEGYSFDKGTTVIPIAGNAERLLIDNPNGSVTLKAGPVQQLEVQTTVWVDKVSEEKAKEIADASKLAWTGEKELHLTISGQEYTGGFSNKRKPRMNVIITVPSEKNLDYRLELRNGKVEAGDISIRSKFEASSSNGDMVLTGLHGEVEAKSTNGNITVNDVLGPVRLRTTNGNIQASTVEDKVDADTTNGSITLTRVGGDADVETINGKITVSEPAKALKAKTVNGAVMVTALHVQGDYKLDTLHGDIELRMPEQSDVEMKASTTLSSIHTNLPFQIEGKKMTGKLGVGTYHITLDSNSKIEVNKLDAIS